MLELNGSLKPGEYYSMEKKGNGRLALLDSLRGLTLISMILFHACWDAVYMLGADWPWYGSRAGYIWQQSICWTFILLSGFCIPFSHRLLRRGLEVFGAGALVMLYVEGAQPNDEAVAVPDVAGMPVTEANRLLKSYGLELTIEGSGLAVSQTPAAGEQVNPTTRVKVRFEPP